MYSVEYFFHSRWISVSDEPLDLILAIDVAYKLRRLGFNFRVLDAMGRLVME